jgi:hypothetical protein
MTMENKAADIDRVLDEDEQIVMETTRMRPYLDIWDVSSCLLTAQDWLFKYSSHPHMYRVTAGAVLNACQRVQSLT